jgi:hypothetical protein
VLVLPQRLEHRLHVVQAAVADLQKRDALRLAAVALQEPDADADHRRQVAVTDEARLRSLRRGVAGVCGVVHLCDLLLGGRTLPAHCRPRLQK